MTLRRTASVLGALALVATASASATSAQDDPRLPESVAYVVSASNLDHTLRVAVFTSGFEHASSRVWLQWLVPERTSDAGTRLVASVLVKEVSGGMFSVDQPTVETNGDQFRVVVEATQVHTLQSETFTFVAERPGAYRVAK